ncbi:intraflagellar transport protein 88 homolog isoform X2 [Bacillus rossius redtenbacheri]|uniref:intraflagellar transport protein 88 homolog isoform X2 n=1 Tax=Bacillus rossius redtenbacheri TaxID=93214 RepID=UPI002FDC923B
MDYKMEPLRFAPASDDDLYSGYNEYPSAFSTKDLEQDEVFQEAIRTSYGRRPIVTPKPGTAMRLGTSSGYREGTSFISRQATAVQDGFRRPMTAVRGAGYTSQRPGTAFDPLNQAMKGPSPQLETKKEELPEERIKKLERRITELIEESCLAGGRGESKAALELAKEASAKERSLIRLHEQAGLSESHNLDLTFSVLFNLAMQYEGNDMYSEALNTYQAITKNRMFTNGSRLKVNMGNIYFRLGQFPKAVKMYRMALDQVPNTHKYLRVKIMHNIGVLFVKMGQFSEACSSFEYIIQEKPDFKSGLHAILCYYALNDKDKMKRGFQLLLEVPLNIDDEEKYTATSDDPAANLVLEAIKNDSLRQMERQMKQEAERSILTAAKLISPVIEDTFTAGYNWCVETIKVSNYAPLASDLEVNKAVMFLKQKNINQAVETLKVFEKKESKVASSASTNLAFIHYLQGDTETAERYGEQAREADSYNSAAFVNLGSCSLAKGDLEKAKELFMCALDNDASCVEALYDLGLVNKQLQLYEEALDCFLKLQAIVRQHPQVLYQVAHLYELTGDMDQATEWYHQLLGVVPSDPVVLQKMGELCDAEGDKQQAYQYHYDSFRHYPSNLSVLNWLGTHFVELRAPSKAVGYFERAALVQPSEVKWPLLVASCQRRAGDYHQALATLKDIHRNFPDNIDCLKILVRLCTDLGLKEATDYAVELRRAEKAKDVRERIGSSRPGSLRSGSSKSSRGSPLSDRGSPVQAQPRGSSGATGRLSKLSLVESDGEAYAPSHTKIDASYSDPLGPVAERPRTSAGRKPPPDEEFADDELGDDLLPE